MLLDAAPDPTLLGTLLAAVLITLAMIGGVLSLSMTRRRIGRRSLYSYDREQRQLAAFRRRLGRQ